MAEPMAVTEHGTLKPVSEFTDADRWWCDGEECGDAPGSPHVHCMMHRHAVDLLTGRSVPDGRHAEPERTAEDAIILRMSPADDLRVKIHQYLREHGPATRYDIARALKVTEGRVKTQLGRMEADGEAVPETTPKTAVTATAVTRWRAS